MLVIASLGQTSASRPELLVASEAAPKGKRGNKLGLVKQKKQKSKKSG
jgi:hypothetical protein